MELKCEFDYYVFNTGEKFYQCIVRQQDVPQKGDFKFIGQHLPEKSDSDVTFVEFRDSNCPKVPQGLTKIFQNLKILAICNSKLKEITTDDLAEYKNLEKFICERNEVEFLPSDLFEGFEKLNYLKLNNNKLRIIEPNLLDRHYELQYVNFKSNPSIHAFYAFSDVYKPNVYTLGSLHVTLMQSLLKNDSKIIKDYVKKFPNPSYELKNIRQYTRSFEAKINILEVRADIHEEKITKEFEEFVKVEDRFNEKIQDLEESNTKIKENTLELKESESKLSQQVEQLRADLESENDEKVRLKRDLQKQIDNLALQIQSIMSLNLKLN